MMRHVYRQLGIGLIVAGLFAAPAWAQPSPARPFRGLFGGNERTPETGQALDFTLGISGAHDDNLLVDATWPPIVDPRYQIQGAYGAMNLALAYSTALAGRAITISGRGGADLEHSPALGEVGEPRYDGALAVGLNKTAGALSINAQQTAMYTPYRMLNLLPRLPREGFAPLPGSGLDFAPPPGAGRDFGLSTHQVLMMTSHAGLGVQLGRRTSFDVNYRRLLTQYDGLGNDLVDQGLGGRLSHRITRYGSLRLGYDYRLTSYSGSSADSPIPSRSLEAGLDYGRPLSLSRRTTLSFGSGSTAISDGDRTVYHATGAAALNHEIGRSWNARVEYNRAVSFLDGFATPYMANGVTAETGGYLGRRLDLVVTAGYADATSVLAADRSSYTTYTGAARLRLALNRYTSLYAQYFYYQYRFSDVVVDQAVDGVPQELDRRGIRGGITLWLPLLR